MDSINSAKNPVTGLPVSRSVPLRKRRKNVEFKGRLANFDMPLFIITLVLMVFGLAMLLSASSWLAEREHGDSYFFFNRQLLFAGVGIALMIVISFWSYRILLNKWVVAILVIAAVTMMILVETPLGVSQGGARRWLGFGEFTFQPSEILKFALIILLANIGHKYPEWLAESKFEVKGSLRKFVFFPAIFKGSVGFWAFMAITGVACAFTLNQPHLSGTIILFGIGAMLMIVSTIRLRYIGSLIALAVAGGVTVLSMIKSGYFAHASDRFLSFFDPEADITGATYQTYQSLITIGSGGWFGLGLGNSRQKFAYMPAANNDFIFSIICEELGFVGGALVLLLFVVFVLRGFYIASRCRDRFGMMVAVGITAQVGIQAFLNIAVVTNSVPNTGITLPFFSYGGTATVMLLMQIGVLLNVSRKAAIE